MIWNDKKFREEKTENTLIVKLLCKLICDQIKINKNQRFIFFENIRKIRYIFDNNFRMLHIKIHQIASQGNEISAQDRQRDA